MKTFFKLTFALFAFIFFAGAVAEATGENIQTVVEITAVVSVASVGVRMALKAMGHTEVKGLAFAVSTEVWETFIADNLYRLYDFILKAKDKSAFVNNSIVHIPQAGQFISTKRNRSVYPVPLIKRSDTDLLYKMDEISGDAIRIGNAEMVETSYDKISSVLGDYVNQLGMDTAKNALYRWLGQNPNGSNLAQTSIVRTTGANVVAHVNATASGNRKTLMAADIASGKVILNNLTKRDMGNRAAIMDQNMYNQVKADAVVKAKETMDSVGAVWKDSELVRLEGFEIIRTDVMPTFTNTSPVAKDPFDESVVEASTDNACVALIDWNHVHLAKGAIEFFETLKNAQSQGDEYSALVRTGASRERADDAGVVAVVQAAGT